MSKRAPTHDVGCVFRILFQEEGADENIKCITDYYKAGH